MENEEGKIEIQSETSSSFSVRASRPPTIRTLSPRRTGRRGFTTGGCCDGGARKTNDLMAPNFICLIFANVEHYVQHEKSQRSPDRSRLLQVAQLPQAGSKRGHYQPR